MMLMLLQVSVPVFASPKLSKKKVSLKVGESCTLRLKGNKKKPKWKTNNRKVVSISKQTKHTVRLTARKAGKAVITVRSGKKTYRCKVTVKKKKSSEEWYEEKEKKIDGVKFCWYQGEEDPSIYSNNKKALKQIKVKFNTGSCDLGPGPDQVLNVYVPSDWKNFIAEVTATIEETNPLFKEDGKYEFCISHVPGVRTGKFKESFYYHGKLIFSHVYSVRKLSSDYLSNMYFRKIVDKAEAQAWTYSYWESKGEDLTTRYVRNSRKGIVRSDKPFYPDQPEAWWYSVGQELKNGTLSFEHRYELIARYITNEYPYEELDCKGGATILAWVCRDLGGTPYYKYYYGVGTNRYRCKGNGVTASYNLDMVGHTTAVLTDDKGNIVEGKADGGWETQGY